MLKHRKLSIVISIILAFIFSSYVKSEAVRDPEKGKVVNIPSADKIKEAPQGLDKDLLSRERKPECVSGEVIIKFRTPEDTQKQISVLSSKGTLKSIINANLSMNILANVQAKAKVSTKSIARDTKAQKPKQPDFVLSATEAKSITGMPEKIKGLLKDNQTTFEPVFKDVHTKLLNNPTKTESQLNQEEFTKLSKTRKLNATKPTAFNFTNVYILKGIDTKDKTIEEIIQDLSSEPNIEYAQPNYIYKALMTPNDPYYNSSNSWGQGYDDLWGLKKIQADKAWDITQGEGVVVAVIDSGVDYNHEDLSSNIWINTKEIASNDIDDDNNGYVDDIRGWNFNAYGQVERPLDNDPMDDYGHGTHCAGIIAAVGNNYKGIIGVAPKAKIMAIKGLNNKGSGYTDGLAAGIKYAVDNEAQVLSNSWGGVGQSYTLSYVIKYAYERNCVVVFAAGNDNEFIDPEMPSVELHQQYIINVGSTDYNDQKSTFSNYGSAVTVSAPGGGSGSMAIDLVGDKMHRFVDILSLRASETDMCRGRFNYGDGRFVIGSNYYRARGTSMACPYAAGIAALLKSKYPDWTLNQVKDRMISTADDIYLGQENIYYTYGFDPDGLVPPWLVKNEFTTRRINAYRALAVGNMPTLKIAKVEIVDDTDANFQTKGNNNGAIDQGEVIKVFLSLKNDTNITASRITLTLKSNDQDINIVSSRQTVNIDDMPVNKEISSLGPFIVEIKPTKKQFEPIYFTLEIIGRGSDGVSVKTTSAFRTAPINLKIERIIPDKNIRLGSVSISNSKVLWQDFLNDIYLYDILTHDKEILIPARAEKYNGEYYYPSDPKLYISPDGTVKVVYHSYDIFLYSGGKQENIPGGYNKSSQGLNIYNNKVIWGHEYKVIKVADISARPFRISEAPIHSLATKPAFGRFGLSLYKDKMVWMGERESSVGLDMYMFDFVNNTEKKIVDAQVFYPEFISSYSKGFPIYVNDNNKAKIVYRKSDPNDPNNCLVSCGYSHIYMYDEDSNQTNQLTKIASYKTPPYIHKSKIAWLEYRDISGINIYDLDQNKEYRIITSLAQDIALDGLSNDKILFFTFTPEISPRTEYRPIIISYLPKNLFVATLYPASNQIPNYGDVNLDGSVDVADVIFLYRTTLGYNGGVGDFSSSQVLAADLDQNGVINNSDATILINYILKNIKSIPCLNGTCQTSSIQIGLGRGIVDVLTKPPFTIKNWERFDREVFFSQNPALLRNWDRITSMAIADGGYKPGAEKRKFRLGTIMGIWSGDPIFTFGDGTFFLQNRENPRLSTMYDQSGILPFSTSPKIRCLSWDNGNSQKQGWLATYNNFTYRSGDINGVFSNPVNSLYLNNPASILSLATYNDAGDIITTALFLGKQYAFCSSRAKNALVYVGPVDTIFKPSEGTISPDLTRPFKAMVREVLKYANGNTEELFYVIQDNYFYIGRKK